MRRAYDTDLFTTWAIAWARADGLASAVGRYRLRGGARGRRRLLAGRPDHSTIVYMLGRRGGYLAPLPSRGCLLLSPTRSPSSRQPNLRDKA